MANKKMIDKQPLKNRMAIITGGSQGIGKALAKEIIQLGGSVCIIARRVDILKEAVAEIEKLKNNEDQIIEMISCDVTQIDKLSPLIDEFIKKYGIPYYLINCVGQAYPNYIEKMTFDDFKNGMDINYYGVVCPILVLLPYFISKSNQVKKEVGVQEWRKNYYGHIINLSSEAGFIGLMGYSTYCPTKFALVGLSECLRHELKPYHIRVSVAYPVDTKTPGFEFENKTKPEELKIISQRAGLMEPEEAAEIIMNKTIKNKFNITIGSSGFHFWAKRHIPGFVFSELDGDLKKARKKLGKDVNY
ncbi:MAG: SDR family oxidoreductase [Candidatus Helarchaeota archaeon]